MSIAIPLLFFILGVVLFLLVIFEDREEHGSDEEQERSDHMIIIMLILCTIFWFIGGVCWMGITTMYYSPVLDSVVESSPQTVYRPISWVGIGFGMFSGMLTAIKMFDTVDYKRNMS